MRPTFRERRGSVGRSELCPIQAHAPCAAGKCACIGQKRAWVGCPRNRRREVGGLIPLRCEPVGFSTECEAVRNKCLGARSFGAEKCGFWMRNEVRAACLARAWRSSDRRGSKSKRASKGAKHTTANDDRNAARGSGCPDAKGVSRRWQRVSLHYRDVDNERCRVAGERLGKA